MPLLVDSQVIARPMLILVNTCFCLARHMMISISHGRIHKNVKRQLNCVTSLSSRASVAVENVMLQLEGPEA